ncbi:GNAT family N-acetyltransferase [Neolewinella litorea]|uniref:GNAT family N-acetyltransferase n=1 Tax=Neolewinella litorea TaxID=2562452 RepID=A0A4S4NAR3_9BACT|nr:GNAT family N-acetyltransferase [Neolewinella litorea]THH36444.1 GNAT family N-acetyltransferase [Neolewinella litorea]
MLQSNLRYRSATPFDAPRIAQLHARSWRENYRGAMTDTFLDQEARADRLAVWTRRFSDDDPRMRVLLAEEGKILVGFCCLYLDEEPEDGTLLDNLHVHANYHGRGVGKQLMHWAAETVLAYDPAGKLYLWVLEQNTPARRVYAALGGHVGRCEHRGLPGTGPGGAPALAVHFDPRNLLERTR